MPDARDEFDLPPALRERLRRLHRSGPVPAAVDDLILADAHAAIRRNRWRRWGVRTGGAAAAVAAVVMVGVLATSQFHAARGPVARNVPASADDLNVDGRVDVVDALLAAQSGDAARADRIATAAVKLTGVVQ
jgi:hypothetical protein